MLRACADACRSAAGHDRGVALETLLELIAVYGLLVVFVTVLLDQGGIPVPAYPPIIVTSALAFDAGESVWPIVAVATLAALIADLAWYLGGRRFGVRLLQLMCKLSLSPDSCVAQTRGVYARWGAPSLIVAKFVPGFAAVATTLAGETRTGMLRFVFFDGIGALLWSGAAVLLGVVFHEAVNEVLETLETFGRYALPILAALIVAFLLGKWWNRRRFLRQIHMARIPVTELHRLMQGDVAPVILDTRSASQREASGWIPGATTSREAPQVSDARDRTVIVYCDCPNEASAALLALELRRRGFRDVRPLAGGFSAWRAEGYDIAVPALIASVPPGGAGESNRIDQSDVNASAG
jgi:membrane protein DedA with SNARE-associated domain/rhodanese-related sulfurtransferase